MGEGSVLRPSRDRILIMIFERVERMEHQSVQFARAVPVIKAAKIPAERVPVTDRVEGADIRIMTNNVWNNDENSEEWAAMGEDCSAQARSEGFARIYAEFLPDVVNTQEMTALMLNGILANMAWFGLWYEGISVNDPVADFTALIYNPETVTPELCGHHVFGYGSDYQTKGYTWCLFRHRQTGNSFVSLSTHFWHVRESERKGSDAWRSQQAGEVAVASAELAAEFGCPVFVQGDFNAHTDSGVFGVFKNAGFENCRYAATGDCDDLRGTHRCGRTGFSAEPKPGTYADNGIDHMLVLDRGDAEILTFRHVVRDYYYRSSDHFPVYTDVRLAR